MAHNVQGIVVRTADANRASELLAGTPAYPLKHSLSFLPLSPEQISAVLGKPMIKIPSKDCLMR